MRCFLSSWLLSTWQSRTGQGHRKPSYVTLLMSHGPVSRKTRNTRAFLVSIHPRATRVWCHGATGIESSDSNKSSSPVSILVLRFYPRPWLTPRRRIATRRNSDTKTWSADSPAIMKHKGEHFYTTHKPTRNYQLGLKLLGVEFVICMLACLKWFARLFSLLWSIVTSSQSIWNNFSACSVSSGRV